MALKPVTFKIEESEVAALEKEAQSLKPPMARSEYVRSIVTNRQKPEKKAKAK